MSGDQQVFSTEVALEEKAYAAQPPRATPAAARLVLPPRAQTRLALALLELGI